MKTPIVLLALALATACNSGGEELECVSLLPPRADDGSPWPTFAEAYATLNDCTQLEGYDVRRLGACADGKSYIETSTTFGGDTTYFDIETLVGRTEWSDAAACGLWHYGDTDCEEVSEERVECP